MTFAAGPEDFKETLQHHSSPVPGTNTTTIDPCTLWQALPRWLCASRNSLARFFNSQLNVPPVPASGRTSVISPLWPMPLPYLKKEDGGFYGNPPENLAVMNAVNLVVACLNWLHLGRPSRAPDEIRGARDLTDEQTRAVLRLEKPLRVFLAHEPVTADDMGRSASKIEGLESILTSLHRQATRVASFNRGYQAGAMRSRVQFDPGVVEYASNLEHEAGSFVPAKNIVAARINFGPPPQFNPVKFMDRLTAERYLYPLDHAIPEKKQLKVPREHESWLLLSNGSGFSRRWTNLGG